MKMIITTTIEEMNGGEHLVSEEFYKSLALAIMADNQTPLSVNRDKPSPSVMVERIKQLEDAIKKHFDTVQIPTNSLLATEKALLELVK